MIGFIIISSILLIFVFFMGFFAGRGEKDDAHVGFGAFLMLSIWFLAMSIGLGFEFRDSVVRKYDAGKYTWVDNTKTYKDNDSTIFLRKDSTLVRTVNLNNYR